MDADIQLRERVGEHLLPGETFRALVRVGRADGRTAARMTRAEMSPFRLRLRRPQPDGPGTRRDVRGSPHSLAAGLDEHIRLVTHPRLLVLTDRRLLVFAERAGAWRRLFGPASGTGPQLRRLWECPREDLTASTERAGRLRLTFADRSAVTLLTPSAEVKPFLAG